MGGRSRTSRRSGPIRKSTLPAVGLPTCPTCTLTLVLMHPRTPSSSTGVSVSGGRVGSPMQLVWRASALTGC
eukprot:6740303-Lingulodinium_polyedra.AAC.1